MDIERLIVALQEVQEGQARLAARISDLESDAARCSVGAVGLRAGADDEHVAFWSANRSMIVSVMRRALDQPVTSGDRHNIALVLWGLIDRVNALENVIRAMRGQPLLDFGIVPMAGEEASTATDETAL
jgi:hypothetical protein